MFFLEAAHSLFLEQTTSANNNFYYKFEGLFYGFRGGEAALVELHNIRSGKFEEGHELAGYEFISFDFETDKRHKLSVTNAYKQVTRDDLCLPLISNKKNDACAAGVIKR